MKLNLITESFKDGYEIKGQDIKSVIKAMKLPGFKKVTSRKKTNRFDTIHWVEIFVKKPDHLEAERDLIQYRMKLSGQVANEFVKNKLNPNHINQTIELI